MVKKKVCKKKAYKKRTVYRYEFDMAHREVKLITYKIVNETEDKWILKDVNSGDNVWVAKNKYPPYFKCTKEDALNNLLGYWNWRVGLKQEEIDWRCRELETLKDITNKIESIKLR